MAEYDTAFKLIKRVEKSIHDMDKDHGLSLDLNKVAYIAQIHDRMLKRLCGSYEIKNMFINASSKLRKERILRF